MSISETEVRKNKIYSSLLFIYVLEQNNVKRERENISNKHVTKTNQTQKCRRKCKKTIIYLYDNIVRGNFQNIIYPR